MPLFKKKEEKQEPEKKAGGYPTQSQYPSQGAYPAPSAPSGAPPPYSDAQGAGAPAGPPPPYSPYGAPPQQQGYYPPPPQQYAPPQQAQYYAPPPPPQNVMVNGAFDAGARFDGIAQPNIPPPPPGCMPNAAQMAAMQGHNVTATQRTSGWLEGPSGGGYTIW